MKLVLHIGWPKTGTSAIQTVLARNADKLAELGYLYPALERTADAHHSVCGLLIDHDDPLIPQPQSTLASLIDHLRAPAHRRVHTTILSSEGFCRAAAIKPDLVALCRKMQITVIACLRDPLVWANSLLNQLLKMKLFFEDIDLETVGEAMVLRDFRYVERLRMWCDAVGEKNITVLALEEGDDFVEPFLSHLGIAPHRLDLSVARESINRSLGLGPLQLINWIVRANLGLEHGRKVAFYQRLHAVPMVCAPNVLNPRIQNTIRAERAGVAAKLSQEWLAGHPCFMAESELTQYRDPFALDSPDLVEVANFVFRDDEVLLRKLDDAL